MVIKKFTDLTNIYPFELERTDAESNEQFSRRLGCAANIEVLTTDIFGKSGDILCNGTAPRGALSNAEFDVFVSQFNLAASHALVISAKAITDRENAITQRLKDL